MAEQSVAREQFNVTEEVITIEGKVKLKGTLTLPNSNQDRYPVVLMIHGSGRSDRNENWKKFRTNVFKELTELFVSLGVATLRYDKRGCAESEGNYITAGMWDLVDDAESALLFLKNHQQIDHERIILLGHSEGCILAPALNRRQETSGLILLAGLTESLKDAITYQSDRLFQELQSLGGIKGFLVKIFNIVGRMKKQTDRFFQKIEHTSTPTVRVRGFRVNAKWFREHIRYNVADDLIHVTCPTLAITGSKDVQTSPDVPEKISKLVKGLCDWHVVEDVNHLLRKHPYPPSIWKAKKHYKSLLQEPIDAQVKEHIKNWIQKYFL